MHEACSDAHAFPAVAIVVHTDGVRVRWHAWPALIFIACGARESLPLLLCGEPGGHCTTVPNVSSKVVYSCHLHGRFGLVLEETHDGDLPVCLPPELNRWTGNASQIAAIDAMSQDEYNVAVARFGHTTLLNQLAALKAIDASGNHCELWSAALHDPASYCKVKIAARDPACEVPCKPRVCVPVDCKDVLRSDGTINPHACNCNTTVSSKETCHFPGQTVCTPPGD